jgi:hypothetical protein
MGAIVFACLGACAPTKILSAWHDPAVAVRDMRKVLIIAPNTNEGLRRTAENELASKIPNGVPSYNFLANNELNNESAIKAKVIQNGFDGVVVFRIVSVDKEATWVPGAYGGYYGYGAWSAYDPGYVQTDTFVRVDTSIYRAQDNKLAWASTSRTEDPQSVRKLVDSTASAVSKEMREEGIIQ